MAEELYHAFTVTSTMRYRVIVVAEQRVHGRWLQMATTELSTFSARRHPRMSTRPPPAPPVAEEDQVVPEDQAVPQGPPVAASAPPEDQAVPQGGSEDQMVPQSLPEESTMSDAP